VVPARLGQPTPLAFVPQQIADSIGALFYRVHQEAADAVHDLKADAPYLSRHYRGALP
jgi:hypothetical protein